MNSVESQVKSFVEGNDKKLQILKRIVNYEEDNGASNTFGDRVDECDWEPGADVPMSPSYIGMFKNAPFIQVVFDSNTTTKLALKDFEKTKDALNNIENQPDEWSDEWLNQQLGGNKIDSVLENVSLSENDINEIKNVTDDVSALDYWSEYVIPELKHRDNAKKAILLMLASPEDAHGTKGRINILAYGPPGTGKSVIKDFLVEKFNAESIDGPRVSKADITYNKRTDEFGQLPKAHKGILVIEESDEMDEKPLGASLTSLGETGKIEIRDKEIPAKVRGVLLSNFDSVEDAKDQWSKESVNRFDFTIEFDKLGSEKKDDVLTWHYDYFRKPKPSENQDLFMKYLKYCRTFKPDIKEKEEIQEFKENNIEGFENIREGISVMNIAWTVARLNLSDVTLDHYATAFDLVTQ